MGKLGARRLQALCPMSSVPLQDLWWNVAWESGVVKGCAVLLNFFCMELHSSWFGQIGMCPALAGVETLETFWFPCDANFETNLPTWKNLKLSIAIKTNGETEINRFGPLQLLSDAVDVVGLFVLFVVFRFVFEFDVFGERGVYGWEFVFAKGGKFMFLNVLEPELKCTRLCLSSPFLSL